CLTMDRQKFHFTIVEENETLIRKFKEKYDYLTDFAEIEYKKHIIKKELKKSNFTSIFICHTDKIEAVKQAVSIRYALHQGSPNIFIFSNNSEKLNNIFNPYPDTETEPSMLRFEKGNNIFIFNPLENFVEYIVEKNREVEAMAEMAHEQWGGHIKYVALSEHYKQSNRNQVLDNKIRIYLATGYQLYSPELQQFVSERNYTELFSSYTKETLAIMEHRRWTLEKHIDGWIYGEKKNPQYKISPYLKDWNDIPPDIQTIDYKAIDLMIDIIKGKTNETAL
ncbi:MAG: hypothetical protein LBS01_07620, partial [Prevotellaceae bacterium]|nr:hypothetical protein [Prevotellaceae bacterium]